MWNNWLEISAILERRIEKSACSFKDPPFSSLYLFGFNETEHWKQKKRATGFIQANDRVLAYSFM